LSSTHLLEKILNLLLGQLHIGRHLILPLIELVLIAHGAEHSLVQAQLQRGLVEHLALVRVRRDQPVDGHVLLLADAVAARLRLQVILRIPVAVVDDDGVGGRQVDAEAARPRAQQEHELVAVGLAVAVDGLLALLAANAAVDALVGEALEHQVVLDDVQDADHLREDEHLVLCRKKTFIIIYMLC